MTDEFWDVSFSASDRHRGSQQSPSLKERRPVAHVGMKAKVLGGRLAEDEFRGRLGFNAISQSVADLAFRLLNHQWKEVAPLMVIELSWTSLGDEIDDPQRDPQAAGSAVPVR